MLGRIMRQAGAASALAALVGCASVPADDEGARRDGGSPDAGRPIGSRDSGTADAGEPDAGGRDAGPDAGPDGGADGGVPGSAPRLNEFVADHTGKDVCEFVEIVGEPEVDYSDYAVLVVEGDAGNSNPGSVDAAIPVATTDQVGIWASAPLAGQLENGTSTLLVVAGFAGGAVDIDADDDGTIDVEPWTELVDAIAVTDGGVGDLHYAGRALLEPGFDGVSFAVGGASRIPDGADTDSPDDWVRNDFDGEGLGCGTGTPLPGEALNTPGAPNGESP
jgi:uncharacterized protein